MKITVNNIILTIFEGAKVKDAIRMYYVQQCEPFPNPTPIVRDAFGHQIGLDGSLLPDAVLYIQQNNKNFKI